MIGKLLLIIIMLLSSIPIFATKSKIIIDKPNLKIYVVEDTDTIFEAPICVGANKGDKKKKGDMKTPEGRFSISQMQNSSSWKHDFKDGKGERKGAYGPWFIRLKTPKWTSIGIHGTCFPKSIGTRASEGCIRLNNDELLKLKTLVKVGMTVIVLPDKLT